MVQNLKRKIPLVNQKIWCVDTVKEDTETFGEV